MFSGVCSEYLERRGHVQQLELDEGFKTAVLTRRLAFYRPRYDSGADLGGVEEDEEEDWPREKPRAAALQEGIMGSMTTIAAAAAAANPPAATRRVWFKKP